jgi:hypothetical protein
MTPKQAILKQCRFCMNTQAFKGCDSEVCKLNDSYLSNLKRIKAHCLTCVPEENLKGVRDCNGRITNQSNLKCSLHPYRLGHNPKRRGIGGKNLNSRPIFSREKR